MSCVVPILISPRRRTCQPLAPLIALGIAWSAIAGAPSVSDLADQFDAVNYQNVVSNQLYTREGMNRAAGVGPQNPLCREFIHAELLSYGLNAYQDVFDYVDTDGVPRTAGNVIAVKEGVQNPENEIYVIGSHFDSEENPGADDNATGVGTLLEMARIFSQYHFARTIVFCAFDAEEIYDYYGARRLGSTRYADLHRGDNIKGMVSVDMIGWQASGSSSNQAWIYGRPGVMDPIRNDLRAAITNYGDGLLPVLRGGNGDYSDHVAFANAGFQACLLIEGSFSSNPNYHELTDYVELPGYIDWAYAGRMSRSVIGYYATQLEPVDVTPQLVAGPPDTNGAAVLHLTGLPRCQYAIELSTNLNSTGWLALETNATSATDGSFIALDTGAGSRVASFYRARFVSGYVGAGPVSIIVDTPEAALVGDWTRGTSSVDKYGADYQFHHAGSASSYAEFRPDLPVAGDYDVYEWHPEGSNRTTDAPIEIYSTAGTQTVRINQQIDGGSWRLLGRFPFSAGTTGYVRIRTDFSTGIVVLADAVKFVYAGEN